MDLTMVRMSKEFLYHRKDELQMYEAYGKITWIEKEELRSICKEINRRINERLK